jgi:hypothetical protein
MTTPVEHAATVREQLPMMNEPGYSAKAHIALTLLHARAERANELETALRQLLHRIDNVLPYDDEDESTWANGDLNTASWNTAMSIARAALDGGTATTARPEDSCQRCGGANPVWTAPSPLWNAVIREGSINGVETYSVVCPSCFAALAEEQGIAVSAWRFYVTPTGRVWNPETWLWDDPALDGGTATQPDQLRDDHCHQCDRAKGSTATETVDGRGDGWKCVCGWWNWLDADGGTATRDYRAALARAAFVAQHLHAMIDRETWREHGAEWMGQYEGDHHAEQVAEEIRGWAALVDGGTAT